MTKHSGWFQRILFMLIFFLGFGCAAQKLAVKNADTLLVHQLQKRLHLYSQQKKLLNIDIVKFLNDHKKTAQDILPLVDEISLEDKEKVSENYHKLIIFYQQVAQDFSLLISKHMVPLDLKQQKDLFETLTNENRKMAKKDPTERLEGVKDRFKTFFGSVTEKQKQLLTDYQPHFEESNQKRLMRRKSLQEEFRLIFDRDVSSTSRQDLFLNAFKTYQREALDHEKNLEIIHAFLPTISKNQKEHFRNRLKEIKDILVYYLTVDY
jgi:hypothetical protein